MEQFEITAHKQFMSKFLKSTLFDSFEVREVVIHTAYKTLLDGRINQDFFDTEERGSLSSYNSWGVLRNAAYELIAGQKLPTYFKVILSTPQHKISDSDSNISTYFLNITYKDQVLTCQSAVAYKTFTLDQTNEKEWDQKIKTFLFKHEFM